MLQIQTITGRSTQGVTEPFLCTASDGMEYFVKGIHATRASQINEWISGNIALSLGLPVAPFELLEVGEELYEELPRELQAIGLGACFGSQAQKGCTLLERTDIPNIDPELRLKIAAFDWLIRNEDRTIGNSNLLYRAGNKSLIVIDHNCAFDTAFNADNFLSNHIFASDIQPVFTDWILQAEMETWLAPALPAYQNACHNLPTEWRWANPEQDQPARYDHAYTQATLDRINNGQLWSRP